MKGFTRSTRVWVGAGIVALLVGLFYSLPQAAQGDIWALFGTGAYRNTAAIRVPVAGTSLVPGTNNYFSLGSSSYRFANIYTTLLNVSGASTFTGSLGITGSVTASGDVTATGTITAARADIGIQLSTAPLTSTTLVYKSTGTLVFNTTDSELCVSTSSNQNSFVLTTDLTTACSH